MEKEEGAKGTRGGTEINLAPPRQTLLPYLKKCTYISIHWGGSEVRALLLLLHPQCMPPTPPTPHPNYHPPSVAAPSAKKQTNQTQKKTLNTAEMNVRVPSGTGLWVRGLAAAVFIFMRARRCASVCLCTCCAGVHFKSARVCFFVFPMCT